MDGEIPAIGDFYFVYLPTLWWHYRDAGREGRHLERYRVIRGLGVGCTLQNDNLHLVVVCEGEGGHLRIVWDVEYVDVVVRMLTLG
jgi:hypothetical protein